MEIPLHERWDAQGNYSRMRALTEKGRDLCI